MFDRNRDVPLSFRGVFLGVVCLFLFLSLCKADKEEGNDAYADAGLNAEEEAFQFPWEFAAQENLQKRRGPGLVMFGKRLHHLTDGIV